jgi:hypothetical protein
MEAQPSESDIRKQETPQKSTFDQDSSRLEHRFRKMAKLDDNLPTDSDEEEVKDTQEQHEISQSDQALGAPYKKPKLEKELENELSAETQEIPEGELPKEPKEMTTDEAFENNILSVSSEKLSDEIEKPETFNAPSSVVSKSSDKLTEENIKLLEKGSESLSKPTDSTTSLVDEPA